MKTAMETDRKQPDLKALVFGVIARKPARKHKEIHTEKQRKLLPSQFTEKFPFQSERENARGSQLTPCHKIESVGTQKLHPKLIAAQDVSVKSKTWSQDNQERLMAAGYTEKDLSSKKPPIGLEHLAIWNKPGLTIDLIGEVLVFRWVNLHGKQMEQTCSPEPKFKQGRR